jgi:hypothetical protein
MSVWLLVIIALAAYYVVGAVFARSQAIRLQKVVHEAWEHSRTCSGYTPNANRMLGRDCYRCKNGLPPWAWGHSERDDLRWGLFFYAIGWWALLPHRIVVWLIDHVLATPIEDRREKVRELKLWRRDYQQALASASDDATGTDVLQAAIRELDRQIEEMSL